MKDGYTIKSPPCFAQWTKYLFEVDKYGNQETHSVHGKFDSENWEQFRHIRQIHEVDSIKLETPGEPGYQVRRTEIQ